MVLIGTMSRTLILLSDSNDKRLGGKFTYSARHLCSNKGFLSSGKRNQLLQRREEVLRMLQGGPPRLYDKKEGIFRDLRERNRHLVKGLDLASNKHGIPNKKVYRPAHQRFSGRFFVSLEDVREDFWSDVEDKRDEIEVLFVSALYGLLLWDELTQDYDCYVADYLPRISSLKS